MNLNGLNIHFKMHYNIPTISEIHVGKYSVNRVSSFLALADISSRAVRYWEKNILPYFFVSWAILQYIFWYFLKFRQILPASPWNEIMGSQTMLNIAAALNLKVLNKSPSVILTMSKLPDLPNPCYAPLTPLPHSLSLHHSCWTLLCPTLIIAGANRCM